MIGPIKAVPLPVNKVGVDDVDKTAGCKDFIKKLKQDKRLRAERKNLLAKITEQKMDAVLEERHLSQEYQLAQ